jgi:PAS domain S-box-containing protein
MNDPERFQRRFFDTLAGGVPLASLFEYLPEVYLFVKDRRSRFVKVNEALWRLRGFGSESEMIGLCDLDIHPQHLAEPYIEEDRLVMRRGEPLPNQIWLVPGVGGQLKWFISSKLPLFDARGKVIGIAGVMRDLEKAESMIRPYREMEDAITFVLRNYPERIEVAQLARLTGLSVSQFDRRFKRLYQMTPTQYVLRVRINAARRALTESSRGVAEIALACGFYDQSYFTKQFRRLLGQTPREFRARYRESARLSPASNGG